VLRLSVRLREHFEELYFGDDADDNSVKNYYERQSSGRYSVDAQMRRR